MATVARSRQHTTHPHCFLPYIYEITPKILQEFFTGIRFQAPRQAAVRRASEFPCFILSSHQNHIITCSADAADSALAHPIQNSRIPNQFFSGVCVRARGEMSSSVTRHAAFICFANGGLIVLFNFIETKSGARAPIKLFIVAYYKTRAFTCLYPHLFYKLLGRWKGWGEIKMRRVRKSKNYKFCFDGGKL